MGYNTTLVVYNDALGSIKNDPEFGANLAQAINGLAVSRGEPISVPAGHHANAAIAIETHHADSTTLITVGGNLGIKQLEIGGWLHHEKATQEKILKTWADKLGYDIVPKAPKT